MTEKELENELKYLELSVEKLKLMALNRKRKNKWEYQQYQCSDSDIERVCTTIRKCSLKIKQYAHFVGKPL